MRTSSVPSSIHCITCDAPPPLTDRLMSDITPAVDQVYSVRLPFGGVKQSGYGQKLGPEGLNAYFETHVIYLDGGEFRGLRRPKPTTAVRTSVQH